MLGECGLCPCVCVCACRAASELPHPQRFQDSVMSGLRTRPSAPATFTVDDAVDAIDDLLSSALGTARWHALLLRTEHVPWWRPWRS